MIARVPLLIFYQRALEMVAFLILVQLQVAGWLWSKTQAEAKSFDLLIYPQHQQSQKCWRRGVHWAGPIFCGRLMRNTCVLYSFAKTSSLLFQQFAEKTSTYLAVTSLPYIN